MRLPGKNIRVTFVLLLLIAGLNISDADGQIRSGYRFGINLTSMTIKENGRMIDAETPVGIQFGAVYEIALNRKLAVQSGFILSSKGTDYEYNRKSVSLAPSYLEMPVHSVLYFGRKKFKVSVFAGPYLSTAFGGYMIDPDGLKDLTFGKTNEKDLKLLDIGMDSGINLNLSGFIISFQYATGLRNISPKEQFSMKNRVIGISIGTLVNLDRK